MAERLTADEVAWLVGREKSPRGPRQNHRRRHGVDLAEAWQRAKRRILEASGVSADQAARVAEPVGRARRLAELAAPADMRLSLALTLGVSTADLEQDKSGARLMLETAHKRLGIVGLRSGDPLDEGASERFTAFLRAWFDATSTPGAQPIAPGPPLSQPVALPQDPAEPARRASTRDRFQP